jgi:hypothetical protein
VNASHQDGGASEVIGFVLVTAIVIVASTMVLMWGEPALDRVQSHEEVDSMIRYFSVLESEISGLASGAPEGSTPTWRLAMPRGEMHLDSNPHVWAFVVDLPPPVGVGDHHFSVGAFADGDAAFTLRNLGDTVVTPSARAFSFAGAIQTSLDDPAIAGPWTNGGDRDKAITLELGGADQALAGGSFEVRIYDDLLSDDEPIARIFFIDSGALVWALPAGGDLDRVIFENTGVIAEQDDVPLLHNNPRIPGPRTRDDGDAESVFVRVIRLSGSLSLSGRSTGEVLLGGGGNHGRFAAGAIERVSIYPAATFAEAVWKDFLDDDLLGNTYTVTSEAFGAETVWRAYRDADDANVALSATLVETPVSMEVVTSL